MKKIKNPGKHYIRSHKSYNSNATYMLKKQKRNRYYSHWLQSENEEQDLKVEKQ